MRASHWSKKRPRKKYQGVRNQSSPFHFLHGFLFVSQSYNTSMMSIACKAGIFCSTIDDFLGGNNAIRILPSWKLIVPENWDESKIDFKGAGYDIGSKSFVYIKINTYSKLLNR